ncbi:MAG: hypothetical protein IJY06_06605 [Oscillospiraceae bacterium]|nr:hypothetical protein [Oscillospiraceae bacterium]
MQTFEQKAVMLVGIAAVWILLLIFFLKDGLWGMAVLLSIELLGVVTILGAGLYREWRILAKGESFQGTLTAREKEYPLEKQRNVKAEFIRDNEHYTVVFPMETLKAESLTSLTCTVHCLEHRGKLRCIVRDLQYNHKFDNVGILLPEERLLLPLNLAFSDSELAERAQKQHAHANSVDYSNFYR